MNNNSNILFYSNLCNSCKMLLEFLKQNKLDGLFNYICVEHYKNNPILNNIHSVPTVILSQLNKILVGKEIFIFLQNIVKNKSSNNIVNNQFTEIINNNTNNNQFLENNNKNLKNNNKNLENNNKNLENNSKILPLIPNEMNGFSDKYAYTFTDIASTHNFVNYNENNVNIITGNELKKINNNSQTNYISLINEQRKEQDKDIINYLSEQKNNINEIISQRQIYDKKINDIVQEHNSKKN